MASKSLNKIVNQLTGSEGEPKEGSELTPDEAEELAGGQMEELMPEVNIACGNKGCTNTSC